MAQETTPRARPEPPDSPIDHLVRYTLLVIIVVPIAYAFVEKFVSNWFL